MALLSFWKNNRIDVLTLSIEQVVNIAGAGDLSDDTECMQEFRQFLSYAPSERLFEYARHCLDNSFKNSGFALQDIVNELGRRLDFDVDNGLYRGRSNAIGYDGIWKSKNTDDIVVEVKTTDGFSISLDKIIQYRNRLALSEKVRTNASVLIIVGRSDTDAIEAQVRGSRHAWDIRLLSIERLIKLVQIKEKASDAATCQQIHQLLKPFEYTKIDKIIDILFTTTTDIETAEDTKDTEELPVENLDACKQNRTAPELINMRRLQAATAFALRKDREIIRKGRASFASPNMDLRICCAVSKLYNSPSQPYWYAFHDYYIDFFGQCENSYFILACMDRNTAYAIPLETLQNILQHLSTTERQSHKYWHITINSTTDGVLAINLPRQDTNLDLSPFEFAFV